MSGRKGWVKHVIEAMIFDMDGTLVQTKKLKALSYARAAVELCPSRLGEEIMVDAFKDLAGLSRQEVAIALAAGMLVVAVATPFTQRGLTKVEELGEEWVVADPARVVQVVECRMKSA
jgi:beta-phosphoglucomutase-like phosphatase (HAD superfamily)